MPLRSQAQAAYLKNNKPDLFKEFVAATPSGAKLPYKVKQGKRLQKAQKRPYER
jgi:hypothetical protein